MFRPISEADCSSRNATVKHCSTSRPSWADPAQFLDPALQNLFELCHFSDRTNSTGIPNGWGFDENKTYPRISDRIRDILTPADQDSQSPDGWTNGNASDNDSGSDEIVSGVQAPMTRMTEESSEDESPIRPAKVCESPVTLDARLVIRRRANSPVAHLPLPFWSDCKS